jgi:KTSC domain
MRVATVESTTLATVGYDENLNRLQLEFCSRAVYLYFGVPAAVFESLLDALRRAGISMGSSAGVIPIFRSWTPIRPCRMRKSGQVRSFGDTNGAYPGGVTGW